MYLVADAGTLAGSAMKGKRRLAPPETPPDDEAELARALGDVEPLARRERVPTRDGIPPRAPAAAAPQPAAALQVTIDDERIEGHVADLDPRVLRRLRRGDPAAEAELDLHGLHRDAAERAVGQFVTTNAGTGRRVLRIVHGRGLHSESGAVLRKELARWLATPPCAAHVLAFVPAPATAGGAGAVHVLLRARRV